MSSLSSLPAITFVEKDSETIAAELVAKYEEITGTTLYPSSPVLLFLDTIAYELALHRSYMDFAAKMNLLAYATGDYLDHLGALLGVTRSEESCAITTLRFTLSEAQNFAVLIPAGTRANDGTSGLNFATTEDLQIYAGDTYGDVQAQCTEAGESGNDIVGGQICYLVDPITYVDSVVNLTTTSGGADAEDDDTLRTRIQLAPESFSVAGPSGAYEYWALSANQDIADVKVIGPEDEPGNVYVYPLMTGGELPTEEILNLVEETLNDEKVRPLSDHVFVVSPETVSYNISLTYYIERDSATSASAIQSAVQTAVEEYELWQKSKLGRDINPSELIRRVMEAGALRVEVTSPEHTVLEESQIAVTESDAEIIFGGLEDG